jgi:DNA polymerase-1
VLDNDEEQITTLQEFMGYSFVADNRQEKAVCLLGPGANGKTTILTIWSALLGPANISSVPLHNLSNQFHRVTLHGKLLNIASEISSQAVESEYFKKCVSGDLIDAAHKHKPTFTFMPYARFVFAMNRLPRILDTSYALYRRLLILEFPYIYKDEAEIQDSKYERVRDPLLDRKLLQELPGIFNWSLEGLDRLQEQGILTVPRRHYELLEEYKKQNNPVLAFVEECCVLAPAAEIEKSVLYDAYRNFVVGGGYKALSKGNFFKELYTQYRGQIEDMRLRVRGGRRRVVQGVTLHPTTPDNTRELVPPQGKNGRLEGKNPKVSHPGPFLSHPNVVDTVRQPRGWSTRSTHFYYYYKSPGEREFSHSIVVLTPELVGPPGPPAWLSGKTGDTRVGHFWTGWDKSGLDGLEKYIQSHNIRQIAVDTETTSLIMHQGQLSLIQVYAGGEVFLFHPEGDLSPIQRLIENPEIEVLFQNANFDLVFLRHHGMPGLKPTNVWDTMIAERILCGCLEIGYSLKDLVGRYLQIELIKDRKLRTSFKPDVELSEKQILYAAQDVLVLPPIARLQKQALQQNGLWDLAVFEMGLIPAVMDVSLAGMRVDISKLEQKAEELKVEIDQLEASILETLGQDIKINHGPTLRAALHEIGVKVKATAKENLVKVKHPIGKEILKYRKAHKKYSGFVAAYLDRVDRSTDRLYANFKQMGTVTGRFTCAQPNLQQVPRDGDIRSMFIAEPGHKFIGADFSQVEVRIMAELSGDTALKEIFDQGRDFHAETATRMYSVPINQVTPEMRAAAKTLNFGISYGKGIPKIADDLGVSEAEATEFRWKFFEPFAALRRWRSNAGQRAIHKLFSQTLWGRLRYFNSANGKTWEQWQLKNRGINSPVQGTCGDLFKLALHWLSSRLESYDTKIINLVHDEFVLEAPESEVEEIVPIVKETLESAGRYFIKEVPVVVDIEVRDNWAKT